MVENMNKTTCVWIVLYLVHLVISALAAVGTLSLLCMWNANLMFLAWDYPGPSILVLTAVFSCVLWACALGVRWIILFPPREPLEELEELCIRMK